MRNNSRSFCKHCGNQVPPGEKLCCSCGKPVRRKISEVTLWIVVAIIGLAIIASFISGHRNHHSGGAYTACQSNLKNIGTALEMYSTDHNGHYPKRLSELVPGYMQEIPTCPAAGKDTYSGSYGSATNPDTYMYFCRGNYHAVLTDEDFPGYTSSQGLVTHPDNDYVYDYSDNDVIIARKNLDECKAHLVEIGSALKKFAADHGGKYPETLRRLSPEYLKTIATCPCAGLDTYSPSYQVNPETGRYTLFCTGQNHFRAGLCTDYPRFDAQKGILEKKIHGITIE